MSANRLKLDAEKTELMWAGESEIRATSHTVIYNKKFITTFLSLGLGNTL